jgi:hypothetical protein
MTTKYQITTIAHGGKRTSFAPVTIEQLDLFIGRKSALLTGRDLEDFENAEEDALGLEGYRRPCAGGLVRELKLDAIFQNFDDWEIEEIK